MTQDKYLQIMLYLRDLKNQVMAKESGKHGYDLRDQFLALAEIVAELAEALEKEQR